MRGHLLFRPGLIAGILLMLFCTALFTRPAWATDPHHDHDPGSQTQGQGQEQGQAQGQEQGQGQAQGQRQTADASNSGISYETNENYVYKDKRQTPSAAVDAGDTTMTCVRGSGVGLSSPIAGLSFSHGRKDKDCLLLEASQYELEQGNTVASVKLRCEISYYKKTLGDACIAYLEQKPSLPSEPEGGYVTREELSKLIQRGLVK